MNVTCDLCTAAVAVVAADANLTNATVQTVSVAVMKLCALIGGQLVIKECDFICKNIDHITGWIAAGMNRSEICHKLGLCRAS